MSDQRAELETVQPDDPALAVKLKARPPVIGQTYDKEPKHDRWTLDLLERTCLELRAAGAWDGALVDLKADSYDGGGAIACEVLASRGEDAMPWGWRPSQGLPPKPRQGDPEQLIHDLGHRVATDPPPKGFVGHLAAGWADFIGDRVVQGVLLLVILAAVLIR